MTRSGDTSTRSNFRRGRTSGVATGARRAHPVAAAERARVAKESRRCMGFLSLARHYDAGIKYSSGGVVMRNAVVLLLVSAGLVSAQPAPDKRQAILDYQLTMPRANQLITAMDAMTKYLLSLPDFQDRLRKSMKMTTAEQ